LRGRASARPAGNVRDNREIGIGLRAEKREDRGNAEELFGLLYHRASGLQLEDFRDCAQLFGVGSSGSWGVQLEVGAAAPPFEDRGLRGRGSGYY
jgi:hypothetical protein